MAYSGRAEQVFHQTLLRAFDRPTLEQFVTIQFDIELENVTRPGNFSDVVWDLVRWADRNDRLGELIEKAAAEAPDSPQLKQALQHVRDPELIERRWYARLVPLTTWLLWLANTLLIVALIKVWLVNLVDTTRLLLSVTLLSALSYLLWLLYQRLVGGPVRSVAGILLFRRLITHSRLGRRDWVAFAGAGIGTLALSTLVWSAPRPIEIHYLPTSIADFDAEYVLAPSFDHDPSHTQLQGPRRHPRIADADRFSCGYYQVTFFTGRLNRGEQVSVQLALRTPGVAFADVAFDALLDEQVRRDAHLEETRIELNDVSADQLTGRYDIVFTIQYLKDGQPTPSEVTIHASISNARNRPYEVETPFSFSDWPSRC